MGFKPFLHAVLDVLFPPICHVCRTFIPDGGSLHVCPACRERLSLIASPLCVICGLPFTGAGEDHVCGNCTTSHPRFDAARAALAYEDICRGLIHSFKYRNKTHLRRPLALLIIEQLSDFVRLKAPDLIIPVPLHRKRLRSRGFNQAVLLGEILSSHWNMPMDRHNLRRIRWTEPQVSLSAHKRRTNVKGAFSIHRPDLVDGRRVLLLDDVLTTGSTVEECSRMLKAAGAVEVTVITAARALV